MWGKLTILSERKYCAQRIHLEILELWIENQDLERVNNLPSAHTVESYAHV